ncbi:FG-GAP repeat domain-containing protein [Planctomicrobium sp. SH668]|uniref:FG-GAP repeat domain-containing protein n=1 Tax=Planctomicrobium sp. SH668 TaxID=3448126 RepID=UPI003F5B651F
MRTLIASCLCLLTAATTTAGDLKFREQTIDPAIGRVCYAVSVADVNGDGLQDVVSVSENQVFWYENPSWKRRVIISNQTATDLVCIAPHDIDGDGQVDFVVGAGWLGMNTGTIQWLGRGESLEQPWHVYAIGAEPSLHRVRFADVLGTGKDQLTITPLLASQGEGVRILAFEIPSNPKADRWPATLLNHQMNRVHNHCHVDLNSDGQLDTLAAGREGLYHIVRDGDEFHSQVIGKGATAPDINLSGAGEVKLGRLKNGKYFITSVEPMHGTMLAVYLPPQEGETLWQRHVIDQGFARGHALWTADMDGDGSDEIVFGHSDTPRVPGVNVYTAGNDAGTEWEKQVVDAGGIATEDLVVADLNGDGLLDIIAGGRQTQNVKIYLGIK